MPKKLLDFKAKSKGPGVRINAKGPTKAEMVLYGAVGGDWFGDGITAQNVSNELKALDPAVNELTIRINSGGGDVFEGVAIYNRLKQFKGKKIVMIDGLAASIASIIALAGDEILMGEGTMYMIHMPWTFAMGNRNDLEQTVNRLDDVGDLLVGIYARKTGMERVEIQKMLEDETWMDADQAIEQGFVTGKTDEEAMPIAASVMAAKWFNKAPRNYRSEKKVAASAVSDLKAKIGETLARK